MKTRQKKPNRRSMEGQQRFAPIGEQDRPKQPFFVSTRADQLNHSSSNVAQVPALQKEGASTGAPPTQTTKPAASAAPIFMVKSSKALLRTPPPDLKSTKAKIDQFAQVVVVNTATKGSGRKQKEYVEVKDATAAAGTTAVLGWTAKSNLVELNTSVTYKLGSAARSMAKRVLKKSGKVPKDWFSNYQYTTFLGRVTSTPVHEVMVKHLKAVEAKLTAKHGGPTKDPYVAGNNLGLHPKREPIKGARTHSTGASRSMHFFGLAIDLDYSQNPHIMDSDNDKAATKAVLKRAGLLLQGTAAKFDSNEHNTNIQGILDQNSLLKNYFSLLDPAHAVTLQAHLATAKSANIKAWKSMNLAKARKRIQGDLNWVSGVWSRSKATMKSGGFTNFKLELIQAMDLHWGGTYGDMMHFDMRNKGIGAIIDSCRRTKKDAAGGKVACPNLHRKK